MDSVTISVQNLSSMDDGDAEALVAALNTQATRDYNASCWVTQGLSAPVASVMLVPRGEAIPDDTWHMELLDTSDDAGALGYHEDIAFDKGGAPTGPKKSSGRTSRGLREDNPEVPLMRVFVKTSMDDDVAPSEVASHEMLEALVDPQVVKDIRTVQSGDRIYLVEVGDPVQNSGYTIEVGAVAVLMANFALPAYFGYEETSNPTQYDWQSVLTSPVPAMTKGAYLSYAPVSEPDNWQQEFGSRAGDTAV